MKQSRKMIAEQQRNTLNRLSSPQHNKLIECFRLMLEREVK